MSRGRLIVFEGAEGVGKSTQLQRLATWMRSQARMVETFREPGGTAVGDEIRRVLLDPASEIDPAAEALLFMASRAQLVRTRIRPALDAGHDVLLDRFFLSTYAYQVVGRGLPEDAVRAANGLATGGLVPDLTLLLALPVEEGLARAARRGERDRMERNAEDFHHRVDAAFTRFTEALWQAAHPECGPIVAVDARGNPDEVFSRVLERASDR
ncbi:MAG TPA: dTMP kinase [Gemmatimonadaceae bacterium]|jgi:dTMP kinase|nr:dTMP kinase [Gemmatimonadaceae bacterium]